MTINMTMIATRLFATAALFVLALGCNTDRTTTETEAGYGDSAMETAVLTPQERTDRREALSRRMQESRDRLQELRQKADADNVQNEWDEAVAKIDRESADLGREMDEFGDDSRDAWQEFEARVQRGFDSMDREIDEAMAKTN